MVNLTLHTYFKDGNVYHHFTVPMSDPPQTNYLKNTIPEYEEDFLAAISQTTLFSGFSEDLLHHMNTRACDDLIDSLF